MATGHRVRRFHAGDPLRDAQPGALRPGLRAKISELEPGVYSVTEMRTATGEQETSRLQTMADGTLAVLAGGGAQDVALALVRVGDPA